MFGLEILDVILGLSFVYLLLSLICSAVNEYIAGITNRRGKILIDGLERLLDDAGDPNLRTEFFQHRLIRSMYTPGRGGKLRPPSYIPARTFAMALLDVVENRAPAADGAAAARAVDDPAHPTTNAKQTIRQMLELMKEDALDDVVQQVTTEADKVTDVVPLPQSVRRQARNKLAVTRTELQKLHDSVEVWFNNSMDRVSGAYKRRTQHVLFALGLITAFALNADTLDMWRRLNTDDKLREGIAAEASKTLPNLAAFDEVRARKDTSAAGSAANSPASSAASAGTSTAAAASPPPPPPPPPAGSDSGAAAGGGSPTAPRAAPAAGTTRTDAPKAGADSSAADTSFADLDHARATFDSASAMLRRTQLDFGWGWPDAEKLGLARRYTAAEAKTRRQVELDSAFAALQRNHAPTHADSARVLAETPTRVYQWTGRAHFWPILAKLFGLLLTAFALSLGAPFWFDTLNKIINIRSAGRAPDEKAKTPEAPGKRLAEQPTK